MIIHWVLHMIRLYFNEVLIVMYPLTSSHNIPIPTMKFVEVDVLPAAHRYKGNVCFSNFANEWTGILCKGMKWRETVCNGTDDQCGNIT